MATRYTQPQGGPLYFNDALIPEFAIIPFGGKFRDVKNAADASLYGGAGFGVSRLGRSISLDGSDDYASFAHNPAYSILGGLTLVWSGVVDDVSTYRMLIAKSSGNGATANPFELRVDASSGYLRLTRANGPGAYSSWTSSVSVPLGVPITIVISHGDDCATNAGLNACVNGQTVALVSDPFVHANAGPAIGNTEPLLIGRRADGYYSKGSCSLVAGFGKVLPFSVQREISANPWQIFKGESDDWMLKSSGVASQPINPSLYTNTQSLYSPTVSQSGITQTLSPALYSNTQTYFSPVVYTSVGLSPNLFTNSQSFYTVSVLSTKTLQPTLFNNSTAIFAPTLSTNIILTASLYTSSNSFFNASVSTSKILLPNLYTQSSDFFSATLSTSKTLLPNLYAQSNSFYSPVVIASNLLSPNLYSNTQNFYSATVSLAGGPQQLTANRFDSASLFYSPLVVPGAITIAANLHINSSSFYGPVIATSNVLYASLLLNTSVFYDPVVSIGGGIQVLSPAIFINSSNIFEPLVFLGFAPQVITPILLNNTQSFFSHTAIAGVVQLYPVILDNNSVFYHAVLSSGVVTRFVLRLPSSIAIELSEVSSITTSINLISKIESGDY